MIEGSSGSFFGSMLQIHLHKENETVHESGVDQAEENREGYCEFDGCCATESFNHSSRAAGCET